ncbi:D-2-hydroxyacid dehydrogenase [Oceanispirochaeta crateris]|uniref:D-2-hydroxyacid dehydrogenase n=1 Tax=Oceanispirochaeta crateris TaxID=2518645 RepID=A0A5C1QME9_9SPIO|nr:D-2-hydroxyacid dehydrogenase [Oceanispirochaeta crateris]QEN08140.1 D-2-hydroxyacid dehydrogenase [Oceanispirochaeta crateris]
MKIVVLDGYTLNPGDLNWDGFKALGDFTCYDRTEPEETVKRIADAEIVITNKTELTADILAACPRIQYIGVLATGYNVVDVEAATSKNIPVCNIPTYGTTAVAQFAFALILNIYHHVQEHSDSVHNGDWTNCPDFSYWNFPLSELAGKTMGILGYGRIGQNTGKIAQAFGMKVLAFDAYQNKELECDTMKYASLDELLENSDVISLHCPLFESTKGIINKDNISKMKDGVVIINTSRGPLIVEQDLADALNSGKVRAAGLDVVSTEPIQSDNVLLKAKNCIITPHIAWAPLESRSRLMNIAVDNVKAFLNGDIKNKVN